ncbi:MAG: tRNA 4-thiouridine(8) synthase ThiI, partial [Actinobacteria bacterium]|nr:tRNA 4-thiouridine(8) synthase ThiI [Actinomycetota bacterium]
AERIAEIEHAGALVTGESLGQVASQTLANIRATDDVAELPVFRPLIGSDKQEIIRDAEALHTFEISIQNQSDCCTLFMPRNPETHARLPRVRSVWATLPIDDWVDEIIENVEIEEFPCPAYEVIKPKKKTN